MRKSCLTIMPFALVMTLGVFAAAAETSLDKSSFRRPAEIPFPANNPYTPEKAALGNALFFDPRLSGNENMNCGTYHNPSFGWEAPGKTAVGAQNTQLGRKDVMRVIDEIRKSIETMGFAAEEVASAIDGQQLASHDIGVGICQVSHGSATVNTTLGRVTSAFDEVASQSQGIVGLLGRLEKSVRQLRSESSAFLGRVRAT
jgi:hypothetical protein